MLEFKDYYTDGAAIYQQSAKRIAEQADFTGLDARLLGVATRMVHACADTDIIPNIKANTHFIEGAMQALSDARYIITDSMMVYYGIMQRLLHKHQELHCFIRDDSLSELSQQQHMTLSAAQIDLWRPMLQEAAIVIGNAPTTLYRLLQIMATEQCYPKLLIATPVGFVGAAESKQQLYDYWQQQYLPVPCLTLLGQKGGSAIAASAVNALYYNGKMV